MKSTERIDASNQEMVTISHAEYEAMQAKLTMQNQQLHRLTRAHSPLSCAMDK
jgi:PHD/YefM family antitoxin component YafN of YafNO toxin-antitoxin module